MVWRTSQPLKSRNLHPCVRPLTTSEFPVQTQAGSDKCTMNLWFPARQI